MKMICPICKTEFEGPAFSGEFKDVCCGCFETRFWDLIKEQINNGDTFIINGRAYTYVEQSAGAFGGRTLKVRFFKEPEKVHTFFGSLWCNGDVPAERREEFPDNAEFVF